MRGRIRISGRRWRMFAILAVCSTFGLGLTALAVQLDTDRLTQSLRSSPLTERERVAHVLNRLTYGPRPGDVDRAQAMGVPAFISRQLNPQSIDDSGLQAHLQRLSTIGMSTESLAEAERSERAEARAGAKLGVPIVQKGIIELQQAKLLRAVYSQRQLLEVMTEFWFNHFNIFIGKGADRIFTASYESDVIRPYSLGKFRDLLKATAKSPAMLFYLDNWLSVSPNDAPARRFAGRPSRGLNENYARELLELHTLGVDGGYTQHDVTEVARCFTGWTLDRPRQGGGFRFVRAFHDDGDKTVLGTDIPAGGGIQDGERVLELLAGHPSTASFISTKLCRKFVSDDPPKALIRRCAETFLKTDGDIREVLAVIFSSPEFFSRATYQAKVKSPFELVASALRATGAETEAPPRLMNILRNMGEALYGCQQPNGYPDQAEGWISTGSLMARMKFASLLASGRIPATRTHIPSPSAAADPSSKNLISQVAGEIFPVAPSRSFVSTIQHELNKVDPARPTSPDEIAALVLGSPEFQKR